MPLLTDVFNTWYILIAYLGFALGITIFALHYILVPRSPICKLRGPPSQSWFLGNIRELESSAVGDCEFRWASEYGSSYRLKGGYGEDIFISSDPKAMQFLLQTSGYNVAKTSYDLQRATHVFGKSTIGTTEGDAHKRHRKAMLPAFGLPETKALVHVFQSKASKLMDQWKAAMNESGSFETNIHRWLTRATLDAIGEAAFDYQFGSMDDDENSLGKAYQDMFIKNAAYPSNIDVAWRNLNFLLPRSIARLVDIPTKSKKRFIAARGIAQNVAGKLLDDKWSISDPGDEGGKRDVMSVLAKRISSEDDRTRLTRTEVVDQMGAVILGGHETTSTTLSWSLWELSKNLAIQNKIREEIMRYSQQYPDGIIPVSEYDSMEYTVAFIKEVFRMHPIIPRQVRRAARDLVVPLHDPIVDKEGKEVHEVLLKKGTRIFTSIAAYQRHSALWGSDPHTFRPERWLNMKEIKVKYGVYGNLGVFGAGIHACVGWRFALYEFQTFLITTMQNFRFDLSDKAPKVRRTFAGLMVPEVEGNDRHVSMPLKMTVLKD